MGLFSYVNFQMPCPHCGDVLGSFQTKDCDDMLVAEPDGLCRFYSMCATCETWVEFNRLQPVLREKPLAVEQVKEMGFEMTVRLGDATGETI